MITEEQLFDLRVLATRALAKVCGGSGGRLETDPIARAMTEQRDGGHDRDKFSSCGELPMWMFELVGVRLPWLNRASLRPYRWGMNIQLLSARPVGANPIARLPRPGEKYDCCDTLIIWKAPDPKHPERYTRDAHARIVLKHPTGSMAEVAEYGQPGGHIAAINMTWGGPGRFVQSVLPFAAVIRAADEAGQLVPPLAWEEWLVRNVRDTERAPPPEAA